MDDLIQDVFEIIVMHPGIDTPEVCLKTHRHVNNTTDFEGYMLAKWLSNWHPSAWDETCEAVDALISEGQISFGDDGELHATGYAT